MKDWTSYGRTASILLLPRSNRTSQRSEMICPSVAFFERDGFGCLCLDERKIFFLLFFFYPRASPCIFFSGSLRLRRSSICRQLHGRAIYLPPCGARTEEFTFVALLKLVVKKKDASEGIRLHVEIQKRGLLQKSPHLASSVINMYAKCGLLGEAQLVLDGLLHHNVVCWNALIAGYSQHGLVNEALQYFWRMQTKGIIPNGSTFISILKACGSARAIDRGKEIHDVIISRGFLETNLAVGTALVDMYAKCGMIDKAQQVLQELQTPDVVAWSALIAGYAELGRCDEALNCLHSLQQEGLTPTAVTFISILKACGNARAIHKGEQVHEDIQSRRLLGNDVVLGNALVDMYVKCGALMKAHDVLDHLPFRNIVSWSSLIAGYAQEGKCIEAIKCYEQMKSEGLLPDGVMFISLLKSTAATKDIDHGKMIHNEIVNRGLLEKDMTVGTALVDMYAKCGMLPKAREVLGMLSARNVVTWSALIAGYAQGEQVCEAMSCLDCMHSEGISPNSVTFISILKVCGSTGSVNDGRRIHETLVGNGFLEKDIALGNALVDMYAKCGLLAKALQVLEDLPVQDIVSWNSLIAGYTRHGQSHEALNCFEQLQSEGLSPDAVTFICVLRACGSTGAIDMGRQIHDIIISRHLLEKDIVLGTSLVDMYAKCGVLEKAKTVLEGLPARNEVTWSALIAGYSQQGQVNEALSCLEHMEEEGFCPNAITLLSILSACSHSGLLDAAQLLFRNMIRKYGITPTLEHHTCMVMVIGSVGHFDEAISAIKAMPSDHQVVWLALLGACRKWGNVRLGRLAFDQLMQLDASCAGAYVYMANIFSDAGMTEDKERIEDLMLRYVASSNKGGGDKAWVDGILSFAAGSMDSFPNQDLS